MSETTTTTRLTHGQRRDRRRQIAEAVRAGATVAEACERFGVSFGTAREACRAHGVPLANRRAAKVPTTGFAVLVRLLAGRPDADVAAELGVSAQRVSQIRTAAVAAGFVVGGERRTMGNQEANQ